LLVNTSTPGDGLWVTSGNTNVMLFTNMGSGAWGAMTQPGDNMLVWAGASPDAANEGGLVIAPWSNDPNGKGIRIDPSGHVSIGTPNAHNFSLAVNGPAIFTKAVVQLHSSWPDYVFQPGYHLPSLDSLSHFLQSNHHLPEIPSADSVAKNGLDLGDNQAQLLKKVEELTLYVIQQQKELEEVKAENRRLAAKIDGGVQTGNGKLRMHR
ncbi:MAG TPA: hypothetical protein VN824_07515, partial [Puia sp.]|nr:hypothetical protein [Puia sp.]